MKYTLRKVRITKVDLCNIGANPDANIALFKSASHIDTKKGASSVTKPAVIDIAKATSEEVAAYVESLRSYTVGVEEQLKKAKKPSTAVADDDDEDPTTEEAVAKALKTLPEPLRKRFEQNQETIRKADERATAAEKRAADAEAIAKANTKRAEFVEFQKSVEKDLSGLPGTINELATMLQEAKTVLTEVSYTVLTKAVKAGSEAMLKASKAIGSDKGEALGTALEEIYKSADKLVTDGKFKTRSEAVEAVAKSDPDLYTRYRAEEKARKKAAA